jgi:lipoprotein-anchoring transpeptidase ErfK/SrfK
MTTRRAAMLSMIGLPLLVAACSTTIAPTDSRVSRRPAAAKRPLGIAPDAELEARYAAFEEQGHLVPAVPFRQMDARYYRQRVVDPTGAAPGTVVVDTPGRFLYLVETGGTAMRYGVGIGRDGFAWGGEGIIHWRQPWPRWKPPAEMIARQPHLAKYSVENGGMDPGVANPLGARALYIFENGKDTLYRLHGTPEWQSIGKAVSSGCVRLVNQDVVDLYRRVPHHAPVIVHQSSMTASA